MLTSLSARLFRRPFKTFIPIFLLVIFVITISHFNSRSQYPVNLKPLSSWLGKAESLYYSKDESPYYSWETRPFFPPLKERSGSQPPDLCAGFPTKLLDSIQVILKTGVGEPAKNKAHVATVTSCISNLIVFSDLEEKVGNHHFIDILADLPPSYAVNNSDFETYTAQKQAQSQGDAVGYSRDGWRLDRFKFLPMVEKAYKMRPHASWYVFIETDVYYFWDTLFRLLDQLDPATMHYMGSPAPGSYGRFFAYGGAGTVLSQGLMKRLVSNPTEPPLSVQYEEWVRDDCCGDAVLGYAILNKTGVKLEALYPTFAGDELNALKVDEERWCIPLLALHRVSPEQMTELWRWERTRLYNEKPFLHSTLLAYTHSHLRDGPTREFWDNYSDVPQPPDSRAHFSMSECSSACAADPGCLQYSYSGETCRFGQFLMSGKPVNDKSGEFTSGWNVERMEELGFKTDGDTSDVCKEARWLKPTIR